MSTAQQRFSTGTALVTGGAAGIGEGFVRHLAALGMTVVVADIDEQKAVEVADAVIREGAAAEAYRIDVTDADAVDEMARYVFDRYSSLELLVNNAGVENAGLLWEVSIDRWRKVMDINVDGVFHCLRSFVPRMIEAGTPACIANLSSVGGLNSVAVQAPYIVSKHAVLALTECLHQELSLVKAPIQVSAVLPHSIRSQIFLAAERDAPTQNETANAVFAAMQRANVESGLDPVVAAEHMTEAIARGDFWVFSNDEVCTQMAANRGRQLLELAPPADPRVMLNKMGVSAPA
ncbi:SDR family NAD(P)-dependent oxidoreductase [Rhodococcus chondri]|uniref:SDR family NAD(P)-dependent oxidoreductase n=1 Tax=Rhodococcus chondri TaxID=3065941 RepID=A0ABU7JM88_9NOCA|nr:SDR family NAD(P)-dependent oxidoreductase [Rhodococcus sp. CC-R104]MEE2031140.1 SDR family NAD(P)-dependent oxidoreductase [Rhodococcus sp. CC-R104]